MSELENERNIHWEVGKVSREAREARLGQRGCVVWLTGFSGSGKSTLAQALELRMADAGRLVYVLDGDNVRHGRCSDLGFSLADRQENIRRVGEAAALLVDVGIIVITAFISPFRAERKLARSRVPKDCFIEVHVATSLVECERRDPKGLYKKSRAGHLPNFTGIDSPYETPELPELHIDTATMGIDEAVTIIFKAATQCSQEGFSPR